MNTVKFASKIKGFGIALSIIFSFLLLSATEIQAQYQTGEYRRIERREQRKQNKNARRAQPEQIVIVVPGSRTSRSGVVYESNNNTGLGSLFQIARNKGYHDGFREGMDDARDGDRFDPYSEGSYKEGDQGYKNRYGNRDDYRRFYRQAFVQGYQDAFDQYFGGRTVRARNW